MKPLEFKIEEINDNEYGIVFYYENGKLKSETPYKNGEEDGTQKEYYDNGNLKLETIYKEGTRNGFKEYNKDGKLIYKTSP